MSHPKFANLVRVQTTTTGTGTITLGAAVTGFLTFALGGISDGDVVTYVLESSDAREVGRGTYTASGTTLTRDTILSSTNGGSEISLTGTSEVRITAAAEDLWSYGEQGATDTRNAIINGHFSIGQRGTTFDSTTTPANSDDTYLLDRWVLLSDGNDVVDVSRSTDAPDGGYYSIALDVETADKKFGIFQPIEAIDCAHLIGGVASLSFDAKVSSLTNLDNVKAAVVAWSSTANSVTSDIVSAWGVEGTNPTLAANWTYENTPANLSVAASWARYKIENIAIDTASAVNLGVFIWSDVTTTTTGGSDILRIANVRLEQGPIATPMEPLRYQAEFVRAKRFYWRGQIPDAQARRYASAVGFSALGAYSFDPPMRSAPSFAEITAPTTENVSGVTPSGSVYGIYVYGTPSSTTYYRAYNGVYEASAEL